MSLTSPTGIIACLLMVSSECASDPTSDPRATIRRVEATATADQDVQNIICGIILSFTKYDSELKKCKIELYKCKVELKNKDFAHRITAFDNNDLENKLAMQKIVLCNAKQEAAHAKNEAAHAKQEAAQNTASIAAMKKGSKTLQRKNNQLTKQLAEKNRLFSQVQHQFEQIHHQFGQIHHQKFEEFEQCKRTVRCYEREAGEHKVKEAALQSLFDACINENARLETENAHLKLKANSEAGLEIRCSVCLHNPPTHALIPCGHYCVCWECVKKVGEECPMCRDTIKGSIRIFDL